MIFQFINAGANNVTPSGFKLTKSMFFIIMPPLRGSCRVKSGRIVIFKSIREGNGIDLTLLFCWDLISQMVAISFNPEGMTLFQPMVNWYCNPEGVALLHSAHAIIKMRVCAKHPIIPTNQTNIFHHIEFQIFEEVLHILL